MPWHRSEDVGFRHRRAEGRFEEVEVAALVGLQDVAGEHPAVAAFVAFRRRGPRRLAARELTSADPLRVAVIAALNLADELFRARHDSAGADGQLRARTVEIERLVDAILDEAKARVVNG